MEEYERTLLRLETRLESNPPDGPEGDGPHKVG